MPKYTARKTPVLAFDAEHKKLIGPLFELRVANILEPTAKQEDMLYFWPDLASEEYQDRPRSAAVLGEQCWKELKLDSEVEESEIQLLIRGKRDGQKYQFRLRLSRSDAIKGKSSMPPRYIFVPPEILAESFDFDAAVAATRKLTLTRKKVGVTPHGCEEY